MAKLGGRLSLFLGNNFDLQQDGAPAHWAKVMQDWLGDLCPDFINKDTWPPPKINIPDLNPLDCYVCYVMLEEFIKLNP